MAREKRPPMRSPEDTDEQQGAKLLHIGTHLDDHKSRHSDSVPDKLATPIADTSEAFKAQHVSQPPRLSSPVLKQKLAELLKTQHFDPERDMDPKTYREIFMRDTVRPQLPCAETHEIGIDPETYQRVLMTDSPEVLSQIIKDGYKGGLGGLENPFRRDHFSDMQDIAEAKRWRVLFESGLKPDKGKQKARYMDVVKSLVAAGDSTTPLEEAIAAENERLKDIPSRPLVSGPNYDAMVQFDRRHARAPTATNQTLMNGITDLEDARLMADGFQHRTIVPVAKSSRKSTTRNIDAHLRNREKQRKKEAILINYGVVGWDSEEILPRRSDGTFVSREYPLALKAQAAVKKILSTDAMLKDEDHLEAIDAEGEEFDLVWATKIDYLTNKQPYVIKRRGDLDQDTETEGLEVPPPPPVNEADDFLCLTLSERRTKFWSTLTDTSDSETEARYAAVEHMDLARKVARRRQGPLSSRKRKREDTAEIEWMSLWKTLCLCS